MEDEKLIQVIEDIIREWRMSNKAELTLKKELTHAKEIYWTLRPEQVQFDGIINIIIRENEFGSLTLQNANDKGWFRIIGSTVDQLPRKLDALKKDLFSDEWQADCDWI